MIISNEISLKYAEVSPLVRSVGERVSDILKTYCREKSYIYIDRIKTIESTAEKIETGRFKSWADLDDLYAGTIIVPLITQEEEAIEYLSKTFKVVRSRLRGSAKKAPEVFRFDSSRIIAYLKRPEGLDIGKEGAISSIKFEVQIKTVFEYAWAATTHALAYKSNDVDWRRKRLAAQFKAAVEQLDMLVWSYDKLVDMVPSCNWPPLSDQQKISEFFKRKLDTGEIPKEHAPKDWTRCAENIHAIFAIYESGAASKTDKPLEKLEDYLKAIDNEISTNGIPKSLSLGQFVHGVLGSIHDGNTITNNFTVIGQTAVKNIFPRYHSKCSEFRITD